MAGIDAVVSVDWNPMIDDRVDVLDALSARGEDLDALMTKAAQLRDAGLRAAGRARQITWSRKVFIPVTTLCRDRCHYCVFVDNPGKLRRKGVPTFLSEDQVLAIAQQGLVLGCKEALLTLGDRPEARWPQARQWLDEHGFASTLDYVEHLSRLITRETGLLAHPNPGVMSAEELGRMRQAAPSMGMMLETTSVRLFAEPGEAHFGSPDKNPAVRLRTLSDAGELGIPFTTGILVGIGETLQERADSLFALRDIARQYGHLQEIIVQNFRSKPATAMRNARNPEAESYLATVATARLVMGENIRIQAPPNLSDYGDLTQLIAAGIDDWGGVSPLTVDHVNPERPWPHLVELARATQDAGFELAERLTVHPEYVRDMDRWVDVGLRPSVKVLAAPTGLAAAPIQNAPVTHSTPIVAWTRRGAPLAELLGQAAHAPSSLGESELTTLLGLKGEDLDQLTSLADDFRRQVVGATTSLLIGRTLASNRFWDSDTVSAVATDSWELGASELRVQGTVPRQAPLDAYERIAAAVKSAAPDLHLRAFRADDLIDGARRTGRTLERHVAELKSAGVDSVSGSVTRMADNKTTHGSFPPDLSISTWAKTISAAHQAGLQSDVGLLYEHGESAQDRARYLIALRDVQLATGGFTEIVPVAMPGATVQDHRMVHAAVRIVFHGLIGHVQAARTGLGTDGTREMLRSGADDLGGTQFDIPDVTGSGVEPQSELPVQLAETIARSLGRQLRIRSSDYGEPPRRAR